MGLKDLFKEVTDLAQDSIDSIQADLALKKAEQQRLRAEMDQRIKSYTDTLTEQLLNPIEPSANPFITASDDEIISFTRIFSEKLLLPANSASATKIDMHPYEEKVLKTVLKTFPAYNLQEKFLFQFKDSKGQIILLTTTNLYFKVFFPENHSFFSLGSIPKEKLFAIALSVDDEQWQLLVNSIPLITGILDEVKKFDCITLSEYLRRIKTDDFEISDDQVDAFIQSKIDADTLEQVKTIIDPGEKLVYFAWGLDSLCSKKFLLCTNKKIVLYDRNLATKKSFNYQEITALTTKENTVSFLDLSLTLGMNPNDMEIHTRDAIETISILYSREAQRVVELYNTYKPDGNASPAPENPGLKPEPPQDDPIAMIEKLAVLKEKGIITAEEFSQKKQELLGKL